MQCLWRSLISDEASLFLWHIVVVYHIMFHSSCTGWTCQRGSLSSSASWRTVVCMDRHLGTSPITSLQPSKSHRDIGYVPPTDTGSLCLAVDSTHTVIGLFRLLVQRSWTHCQMNSEIQRVMSTASNSALKQSCSALTSVTGALEIIFNVMCSINPRFTYLLTYFPSCLYGSGWWRGVAVTCCVESTKLVHAGPG